MNKKYLQIIKKYLYSGKNQIKLGTYEFYVTYNDFWRVLNGKIYSE